MLSSGHYTFQQDRATPHTAKKTVKWLKENAIKWLEDYPGNSPELNSIKYVWFWMVTFVKKERPTNRKQLENAILKAWDNLPRQDIICFYIKNLRTVGQRVIAADGGRK